MYTDSQLSIAYSNIKESYVRIKDKCAMQKIKIRQLEEENAKLINRVGDLQDEREQWQEGKVITLPKNSNQRNYVSAKTFNKQKALTDYFINLYHKERDSKKTA
jgi:hypothetical protein